MVTDDEIKAATSALWEHSGDLVAVFNGVAGGDIVTVVTRAVLEAAARARPAKAP